MNVEVTGLSREEKKRRYVEKISRDYLMEKQGSVDETFLQNMVSIIFNSIYEFEITRETVTKDFVEWFSTRTGGKCIDGQIEVKCKNCNNSEN